MDQIVLTFSLSDIDVLNICLALGPYGKVAPLIQKINNQIAKQQQQPPDEQQLTQS